MPGAFLKPVVAAFFLNEVIAALVRANPEDLQLTTAGSIRHLSAREAQRGHTVQLRGVVTFSDSRLETTFVDDGTAGIYVNCGRNTALAPGMRVEVNGITAPGHF